MFANACTVLLLVVSGLNSCLGANSFDLYRKLHQDLHENEQNDDSKDTPGPVEDPHRSRDLLLSKDCVPCDQETIDLINDPTLDVCLRCKVQWDEAATLSGTSFFYTVYRDVTIPTIEDTLTYQQASSTETYVMSYLGAPCQSFDACVNPVTHESRGQYTYDCRNVYCGPNALRDCSGIDYDAPCVEGLTQPAVVIPSLNEVSCKKYRSLFSSDWASKCGPCTKDERGHYATKCDFGCLGCSQKSGMCVSAVSTFVYSNVLEYYRTCFTESLNGGTLCINRYSGHPASPPTCGSYWNGLTCASCSICAHNDTDLLYDVDCSNVVGAGVNQCKGTTTGTAFNFLLNQELTGACDGSSASSNAGALQPDPLPNSTGSTTPSPSTPHPTQLHTTKPPATTQLPSTSQLPTYPTQQPTAAGTDPLE